MRGDRRYMEAAGIILILFSVVLILSIISFSVSDFKLLAVNRPVHNTMGPLGAYFSDFLRGAFGYSSFVIIFIFGVAGWSLLKNGTMVDVIEKIFSLFYIMIIASVLISLLHNASIPHFSGGYTGLYLSKLFVSLFSDVGAFLIVLILNIVGLVLLGVVSFSSMLANLENKDKNISLMLKNIFKKSFIFQPLEEAPLNTIDEAVKRKEKKPPWIIKKRIIIGMNKDRQEEEISVKNQVKLIELNSPDYLESEKYELSNEHISSHINYQNVDYEELSDTSNVSKNDFIKSNKDYFSDIDVELNVEKVFGANIENIENTHLTDNLAAPESSIEIKNDEITFRNYTDDPEINKIETNRITAVVLESETKPDIIMDEKSEEGSFLKSEDKDFVEQNFNKTLRPAINPEGSDAQDNDEKVTRYIPRVFKHITMNEEYIIPTGFLDHSNPVDIKSWKAEAKRNSDLLISKLQDFGIESKVVNINRGPVITLYEIKIAPGIKVNRIVSLSDDIAMALAAYRVRIVAPIPGKSSIGIEIPNKKREMVTMGDMLMTSEYQTQNGRLKVGLGKDILGKPITFDLKKQPHLLIAGATGAGKSICLNSIICGLIYNYSPNYIKFILVDPKMVELQPYNGLPHLLSPVITESHEAPRALKWAVCEMERRYKLLSEVNCRDVEKYNEKIKAHGDDFEYLPYIVIIIDELADLMMIAAKEIEGFITRIAQKARAVGIHMILATQRPSVDIITGIIKANFPARIAFQVAQKIDSRTILDQNGAESLLGKGDMLYQSPMSSFPVRAQGAFITEEEVMELVKQTRKFGKPSYIDIEDSLENENDENEFNDPSEDGLFLEALKIVEETRKASASYLQRRLSIGYNRAARIIEMMEDRGYVGPLQGSKPREVYI